MQTIIHEIGIIARLMDLKKVRKQVRITTAGIAVAMEIRGFLHTRIYSK
jgi:hypothetical protein